jgi:hypothetical protein
MTPTCLCRLLCRERDLEVSLVGDGQGRLKQRKKGFLQRLLSPRASEALETVSIFKCGCHTQMSFIRCRCSNVFKKFDNKRIFHSGIGT